MRRQSEALREGGDWEGQAKLSEVPPEGGDKSLAELGQHHDKNWEISLSVVISQNHGHCLKPLETPTHKFKAKQSKSEFPPEGEVQSLAHPARNDWDKQKNRWMCGWMDACVCFVCDSLYACRVKILIL